MLGLISTPKDKLSLMPRSLLPNHQIVPIVVSATETLPCQQLTWIQLSNGLGPKRGCTTGIEKDGVKQSNAIELVFMGPEACMVNAAGKQQRTAYTKTTIQNEIEPLTS